MFSIAWRGGTLVTASASRVLLAGLVMVGRLGPYTSASNMPTLPPICVPQPSTHHQCTVNPKTLKPLISAPSERPWQRRPHQMLQARCGDDIPVSRIEGGYHVLEITPRSSPAVPEVQASTQCTLRLYAPLTEVPAPFHSGISDAITGERNAASGDQVPRSPSPLEYTCWVDSTLTSPLRCA